MMEMQVEGGARTGIVPLVDIAGFESGSTERKRAVAREVGKACESIGFLIVRGHDVPARLVEEMVNVTYEFFELPTEEKLRYVSPSRDIYRGYFAPESTNLANTLDVAAPPDLCEFFMMSRFDDPAAARASGFRDELATYWWPNIWPKRPARFREVWQAYYDAMEELGKRLMRIFAVALELPREDWFDDKIDNSISPMIVNYYPPQPEPPRPGQLRRGAHTDYGSLTIVHQDTDTGGMQVQWRDGKWYDVPCIPGSFVVNLGDLMARWTNDRWVSTMHRAVNPPREHAGLRRMSVVWFQQPNFDAEIACIPTCMGPENPPKYEPTTSGEWALAKLRKTVQ